MYVNIEDNTEDWFDMIDEECQLELNPWFILNANEIGILIAFQFFDAEYDVTQEYLDEEINDYLSHIHEQILEKTIDVLEQNGIKVY